MRRNFQSPLSSRLIPGLIPVAALILLGGVSCDRPKAPVAHVGATWIGQPEWAAYRVEQPGGDLAGLIRQEVAFQLAEKQGLLSGIEWQDFLSISRRAALSHAYLAGLPGHSSFSERQARDAYLASDEKRHVSHILCATQDQAKAALKRITAGEAFEAVASAMSTDPSVKQNHGDLGWITKGQVVAPFAAEVFSANPGALCGPFLTEFGWHIAKVQEVKAPDPAEFEKNKASLMAGMQQSLEAEKRATALKALRKEYPLITDKAMLDLDRTTVLAPGDESRQVGRIGDKAISLRELKLFLSETMKMAGSSHGLGPETKGQFLEILADDYRLAAAAEKQGLDRRPDVKAAIWMSQRRAAFDAFSNSYLSHFLVPEPDLEAFYNANKERFHGVGAVRLYLLVADQLESINNAAKEAAKGTSWSRLFEKYANKVTTGHWDAGWLEVSSLQKVLPWEAIQAMLQSPEGSLIGPIQGPDGFILFKVLMRKPGDVLPLKDCRDSVKLNYLKDKGTALVDKHLDAEGRQGIKIQEYPENAVVRKLP